MSKLIQEAALDDAFNVQMKKIQDAVSKLDGIIDQMQAPGSMHHLVQTQRMALRHGAEDLQRLLLKAK